MGPGGWALGLKREEEGSSETKRVRRSGLGAIFVWICSALHLELESPIATLSSLGSDVFDYDCNECDHFPRHLLYTPIDTILNQTLNSTPTCLPWERPNPALS